MQIEGNRRSGKMPKVTDLPNLNHLFCMVFFACQCVRIQNLLCKGSMFDHRQALHRPARKSKLQRQFVGTDQRSGIHNRLERLRIALCNIEERRMQKVGDISGDRPNCFRRSPCIDSRKLYSALTARNQRAVHAGRRLCFRCSLPQEIGSKIPHSDAFAFVQTFHLLFKPIQRVQQRFILNIKSHCLGTAKRIAESRRQRRAGRDCKASVFAVLHTAAQRARIGLALAVSFCLPQRSRPVGSTCDAMGS